MSTKYVANGSFRGRLAEKDFQRRARHKRLNEVAAVIPKCRNDLLPLTLVDRDPRTLVAPARNVREVDAAHVREIANSLSTLGFSVPVLIDP